MDIKRACIYCGATEDLSESDIIPDALTNARITNKNVCRVEHNNKFSDMFESKVIEELAYITNQLDIKSSKSDNYSRYTVRVEVKDKIYTGKVRSVRDIGKNAILSSEDKKYKLGNCEKIKQIAKNRGNYEEIDIDETEVIYEVNINKAIFFDESMFRLVSKIAYEWFCKENNVIGVNTEFENIVNYITTGRGICPVSIIEDNDIYKLIDETFNFGSHVLIMYEASDGTINVIVILFGIIAYNVVVSYSKLYFCKDIFSYIELTTSGKHNEIKPVPKSGIINFINEQLLSNCDINNFEDIDIYNKKQFGLWLHMKLINIVDLVNRNDRSIKKPAKIIYDSIDSRINRIFYTKLITVNGLKKYIKLSNIDNNITLNAKGKDKEDILNTYIIFKIGESKVEEIDDDILQCIVKNIFDYNGQILFDINDEVAENMKKEMLNDKCFNEYFKKGIELILKNNKECPII